MSSLERINGLIDELEIEIEAMGSCSKQSSQAAQAARVLEKSIEELKSKRVRVPEQMLMLLSSYRAQAVQQETNKAAGKQVYNRLAQILRKLPRPAANREKTEGISRARCGQVILEILLGNGGQATRLSVLEKAQEMLQSELTDYDLEILQKGKPRWHTQLVKAHEELRLDGKVSDGPQPGVWVINAPGL